MLITNDLFLAFIQCETKARLLYKGEVGSRNTFMEWQEHSLGAYKQQLFSLLHTTYSNDSIFTGAVPLHELEKCTYQFILDYQLDVHNLQTSGHALERILDSTKTQQFYIPVRFVPNEKIAQHNKLLLAFDSLVLTKATSREPQYGVIIHGRNQKRTKVQLEKLTENTKSIIERIATDFTQDADLKPILNKHCPECEFQSMCRQHAIKNDDLSLLAGMTAIERQRYHNKGIFTVTQLSYTFHPHRKHKHVSKSSIRPMQALRARAIREHKIHLDGIPKLSLQPNLVFLDVEGLPNYGTYYLIGLRIKHSDSCIQSNFWADTSADEKTIWNNCLTTLMTIDHPQLIYYGTYETTFLKRMKVRYCDAPEHKQFVDQLLTESINILSTISARIYFPTFSNGLKDIARYLGFNWSHPDSSGLSTLAWRAEWESAHQITVKQQLVTYNMEDCEAVEYVTKAVSQLALQYSIPESLNDSDAVLIELLQLDDAHRFQLNSFAFPELNLINQSAYWDYQRDKIYIRSNPRLKYIAKRKPKGRTKLFSANKVIDCPIPDHCPKCQSSQIFRWSQRQKVMYDLKFGRGSIKRWVTKYVFHKYKCSLCNEIFDIKQELALEGRYGQNILAYIMYQMIELNISQIAIADNLNQMFGFHFERHVVHRQKALVANRYIDTYEHILKCIAEGNLVHVDETKVTISGEDEYVWVITNLENVIYFHTKTRAGDKLHETLSEFKVSWFLIFMLLTIRSNALNKSV